MSSFPTSKRIRKCHRHLPFFPLPTCQRALTQIEPDSSQLQIGPILKRLFVKNGQKKRLFVHPKNHRNFPNLMMQVLSLPLGLIKTIIHADFDDASRVNATDASQQRLVL
jgi:hypothetical protein